MTSDKKTVAVILLLSVILTGCGGSRHPRETSQAGAVGVPQFVELRSNVQASTLHFPAGTYTLANEDQIGYYYRAPRKILQHLGGGSIPREGGIFVSKHNREKLRGYVYLGGVVTHVGNFSHADYEFRN